MFTPWRNAYTVREQNKAKLFQIRLELAIVCNCSLKYSIACYNLEGDGPIAAFVFNEINDLFVYLETQTMMDYEDVHLMIEEIVNDLPMDATQMEKQAEKSKWNNFCLAKMDVAKNYFISHFLETNELVAPSAKENNFGHLIRMYEVFALVDPRHMRRKDYFIRNSNDDATLGDFVRSELAILVNMERITEQHARLLVSSVTEYARVVQHFEYRNRNNEDGIPTFEEKLQLFILFWLEYKNHLPYWFDFVKIVMLHQPNSCAVERLFSVLKRVLKNENENCLDDYITAAVSLAYNNVIE